MVARMARLHHVNLGIPVGGTDAEAGFLVDLLGYKRIEPPPALASVAKWFEYEDGTQIHLSEDPDHRPAARAHVAVELGDELGALERSSTKPATPTPRSTVRTCVSSSARIRQATDGSCAVRRFTKCDGGPWSGGPSHEGVRVSDLRLLIDKVAVITGAANGIGAATAQLFAEHGAVVYIADIDTDNASVAGGTAINASGGDASRVTTDVRDLGDVERLHSRVVEGHGRCDVLVNNAGHWVAVKDLVQGDPAHWQALYEINLLHIFA